MPWQLLAPGSVKLDRVASFIEEREDEYSLLYFNWRAARGVEPLVGDRKPLFAIDKEDLKIKGVASFLARNLILSHMSTERVPELVDLLLDEVKTLPGVVGPPRVVETFAEHWCQKAGAQIFHRTTQGLYRLDEVRFPPLRVPGQMRVMGEGDIERIAEWAYAFQREALPFEDKLTLDQRRKDAERRFQRGDTFVWEKDGKPVACAALARSTPHGVTVNFVYTPPEHRKHGYASALVAQLSDHALKSGRKFCTLFTDLANPTSNAIYMKIGYRRIGESLVYRFQNGQ